VAEKQFSEAVRQSSSLPSGDIRLAFSQQALGETYAAQHKNEQAVEALDKGRRIFARIEKAAGGSAGAKWLRQAIEGDVQTSLDTGILRQIEGRLDEARESYEHVVNLHAAGTPAVGQDRLWDMSLVEALVGLSDVAAAQHRSAESSQLYSRLVELDQQLHFDYDLPRPLRLIWAKQLQLHGQKEISDDVASSGHWGSLEISARAATRKHDLDEAIRLHRQALENVADFGDNDIRAMKSLNSLGIIAERSGDTKTAKQYFKRVLSSATQGADDEFERSVALIGMADSLVEERNFHDAVPLYERALELRKKRYPESSLKLATARAGLALCQAETGWSDEARKNADAAAPVLLAAKQNRPKVATSLMRLGRCYARLSAADKSHACFQAAADMFERCKMPADKAKADREDY
jgi:tetratricopeptide (TPR) repeat protein